MGGRVDGWMMLAAVGLLFSALIALVVRSSAPLEAPLAKMAPLEKTLTAKISVSFVDQPLHEILDQLGEKIGCSIVIRRKKLAESNISLDSPLTMRGKDVVAETLLSEMLAELNLTFHVTGNALIITTQEDASQEMQIRVYDCRDFYPRAGAKGGGSDSGEKSEASKTGDWSPRSRHYPDYDPLVDLITTTVAPQSWDEVGGPGSVERYQGILTVRQTRAIHRELERTLNMMRRARDLTPPNIHIEQ